MDLSNKGLTTLDQCPLIAQAMDLSYNKIMSLKCGATHSHAAELHSVEELVIQHNRLSTLEGISALLSLKHCDMAGNSLRRVTDSEAAELYELAVLRKLDMTENNISQFDLKPISSSPNAFQFLTTLRLGGNCLTSIPNVSGCPALQELYLDHNQISDISELDANVPPGLRLLTLHSNEISEWWHLSSLTGFAESLAYITLAKNPFVSQINFSIRMFIAWLLPLLETFDDAEIPAEEKPIIDAMFRTDRSGQFSEELLGLMDDGRERELQAYLEKCCVMVRAPQPSALSGHHRDPHDSAVTLHGSRESLFTVGDASDIAAAVNALSTKLRNVNEVVKVLRRQDMKQRIFAATTLQRYWRGRALRKRLSHHQWSVLLAARKKRLTASPSSSTAAAPASSASTAAVEASVTQLQRDLRALDGVVKSAWNDMIHLKGFVYTQRVHAAKVVQSWWRGCRARRRFKAKQAEYRRFANKFTPFIIKLQAFVRMIQQRKRYLLMRDREREYQAMKVEVTSLRSDVDELKRLVQVLTSSSAGVAPAQHASSQPPALSAGRAPSVPTPAPPTSSGWTPQQFQESPVPQEPTRMTQSEERALRKPPPPPPAEDVQPTLQTWAPPSRTPPAQPTHAFDDEDDDFVDAGAPPQSSASVGVTRTESEPMAAPFNPDIGSSPPGVPMSLRAPPQQPTNAAPEEVSANTSAYSDTFHAEDDMAGGTRGYYADDVTDDSTFTFGAGTESRPYAAGGAPADVSLDRTSDVSM